MCSTPQRAGIDARLLFWLHHVLRAGHEPPATTRLSEVTCCGLPCAGLGWLAIAETCVAQCFNSLNSLRPDYMTARPP